MKAKLPNTKYLGCDLYIDKEEEYDGQAEEYAEIVSNALSSMHDELRDSVPISFISEGRRK
jgi:hypothetical protein